MAFSGGYSPLLGAAASGIPNLDLAATEGSDVADCAVNVTVSLAPTDSADIVAFVSTANVSLAVTEGSDVAAFEADVYREPISLAATEGSDTAALTATVNVRLQVTEAGDDATARVNVNASLAATEGSDIVALQVNANAALAATEGSDVVAVAVNATTSLAATEQSDTVASVVTANSSLAVTEESDTAEFGLQRAGTFELAAEEGSDTASMALSADAVVEQPEEPAGTRRSKRAPAIRPLVDAVVVIKSKAQGAAGIGRPVVFAEVSQDHAEARLSSVAGYFARGFVRAEAEENNCAVLKGCAGRSQVGTVDVECESVAFARVDPKVDCTVQVTLRNAGRVRVGRLMAKGIINPTDEELLLMIATAAQRPRLWR
jgi:hypothetical protein